MIDANGMVVLFEGGTEKEIDTELKRLDLRLFLTRERDGYGQDFYVVMFWEGSEHEATVIVDWREENGRAKPLSSGLVYEVQRMMKRGPLNTAEIRARNAALQAKRAEESRGWYSDVGYDFAAHRVMGNFMVMPRSANRPGNWRRQRRRDLERYWGLR